MRYNIDEEELYKIIKSLSDEGIPLVFKGALALKAALDEFNSPISRKTRDIDANWIGEAPTMDDMENQIRHAVQNLNPELDIQRKRSFGEHRSAGFSVLFKGDEITSFDIDIKKSPYVSDYENEILSFRGNSLEAMLADKIQAISKPQIMRRTKDILDTYNILTYGKYNKNMLIQIENDRRDLLGNFETLYSQRDAIKHAYDLLQGISNKPDFDEVYNTVVSFCSSLMEELETNKKALANQNRKNQVMSEKMSVEEIICRANEKALQRNSSSNVKEKMQDNQLEL